MITFILPTSVILPRKTKEDKKQILNLNNYHNLHYQTRAQMKREFVPLEIPELFKAKRIEVSYHVEKKTGRLFDTMNVISIVDKCFLDWLIDNGFLIDDTCENVCYGSITGARSCKENRVLAYIEIMEK